MRVVAGSARGRRLVAPSGDSTRPTSDRVRESVFNALVSLDAVRGASVADLFAGSGALGIEALSRGARSATFVDSAPEAIAAIRTNVSACSFGAAATVRCEEVGHWASTASPVDLALLDPPYAFDGWLPLLDSLRAGLVVIETDRTIDLGGRWRLVRERAYGTTVVLFAAPTDPSAYPEAPHT